MPDMYELAEFFWSHGTKIKHACLEKAQTYPHDSKPRAFNYGTHYGTIQGILISHSVEYTLVTPKEWQKQMICSNRSKDPKERALASANKIFKKTKGYWLASKRCKNAHDGMIDAALIARYCLALNKSPSK